MSPSQSLHAPAEISADYVLIVRQTLEDFPQIRPEVATMLAQDGEYFIRELIHISKKHMRHSKRSRLTVQDIELAGKLCDPRPLLGHSAAAPVPEFQPVQACPGLYVTTDSIVSLIDVLQAPIPLPSRPPSVIQSRLIVPQVNLLTNSDISQKKVSHPTLEAVVSLLSSREPPSTLVDTVLSSLSSASNLPLQPFVTVLRDTVHQNARSNGNTTVLQNAMRMSIALASRTSFGIELFEDAFLPSILTCLLAPNLGRGDVFALRQLAAESLHVFLADSADDFVRQRVCNTLASTLTDATTSLASLYGAITGLATMGPDVFEPVFVPCIPKLISGLGKVLQVAHEVGLEASSNVEQDVVHVCHAVERGMYMCRLVQPDIALIDVVL